MILMILIPFPQSIQADVINNKGDARNRERIRGGYSALTSPQSAITSYILPPESKISTTGIPQDDILGTNSASIFMARNEEEYFQIALKGPLNNIDMAISSDFTGINSVFPSSDIKFYRETFIKIEKESWDNMEGNYPTLLPSGQQYADGLVPFDDPYDTTNHPGKNFNILDGEYGAILVKFNSQTNQVPGSYSGSLRLTADEGNIDIAVNLVVFDILLPNSTIDTLYNVEYGYQTIATLEGLVEESAEYTQYRSRYYDFLADYGLFPGNIQPISSYDPATDTLTMGKMGTIIEELVDKGMRAVSIPSYYDELAEAYPDGSSKAKFDDAEWRSGAIKYYQAWAKWLSTRGLLDSSYAFVFDETEYVSDEPYHNGKDGYDRVWDWVDLIYEANPKIRFLLADNILPMSTMEGYKDVRTLKAPIILDVYGSDIDIPGIETHMENYRKNNKDFWLVPNDHYDYIDYSGIHPRAIGAFSFLNNITGIEAWATISWAEEVKDPWTEDPANPYGNGAGAIIYPGKHWNVKGPLGSLRMELNREALEDHAYFTLLQDLGGYAFARDISNRLIPSDISWIDNGNVTSSNFRNAKLLLAGEILRLSNSTQLGSNDFTGVSQDLPTNFGKEPVTVSGMVYFENSTVSNIQVTDGYSMTKTDNSGRFTLTTVAGNKTITVERIQSKSMIYNGNIKNTASSRKSISIDPGNETTLTFYLEVSTAKVDILDSFEGDMLLWYKDGSADIDIVDEFPNYIKPTDGSQMLIMTFDGEAEIAFDILFSGDAGALEDEIWIDFYLDADSTYTIVEIAAGEDWEFYREVYFSPGGPYTLVLPVKSIADKIGTSLDGVLVPVVLIAQTTIGEQKTESDIGERIVYVDEVLYVHSSDSSATIVESSNDFDFFTIAVITGLSSLVIIAIIILLRRKKFRN